MRTALPPERMENVLPATVRSIDPQLPSTMSRAWNIRSQTVRRCAASTRCWILVRSHGCLARSVGHLQRDRIFGCVACAGNVDSHRSRFAASPNHPDGDGLRSEAGSRRLRYWARRCLRRVTPRSLVPFWRERVRSIGDGRGRISAGFWRWPHHWFPPGVPPRLFHASVTFCVTIRTNRHI